MSLTTEDVKKIANLARIKIDDETIPQLTEKLTNVLKMIAQMEAVDTTNIEPMSHAAFYQRLREDVVDVPDQRELMQSLAPKVEAGLYLVPKVIE